MGNERVGRGPESEASEHASSARDHEGPVAAPPQPFDFVISSGTAEHVADVLRREGAAGHGSLLARVHQLRGNAFAAEVAAALADTVTEEESATPYDFAIGGSAGEVAQMIVRKPTSAPAIMTRARELRGAHFAVRVEAEVAIRTGAVRGADLEAIVSRLLTEPSLDDARQARDLINQAGDEEAGVILVALDRRGHLGKLCRALPFGDVRALHERLPLGDGFGTVKSKMRPYFEQRDTSDNSVGTALQSVPGVGGVLHAVYNGVTFGALEEHDRAYRAKRAGFITEEEYVEASNAANRKAIVVGAVSTATGGAAGAYAEGATATLAATGVPGRIAANTITGAAAGAGGGFGTQFAEDAYAGDVSSPDEYLHAIGMGAAFGAGFGGVGSGLIESIPVKGRAFLAARIGKFPDVFQRWRALGERHDVVIQVHRLRDLIDDGAAAFANPQLAAATAGLAPGVRVRVTADLGERGLNIIKAERLPDSFGDDFAEPSSGSVFDDFDGAGNRFDDPWELRTDADELAPHADVDGAHHPHDLRDEVGMGTMSDVRLGLTREPRHHVLPQEEIAFFQERGFPGRAIDEFTVELPSLDHDMVHGGNQALARQHWPEREWNTALMSRLRAAEAKMQRRFGPGSKLSRSQILDVVRDMMNEFSIGTYPFVGYHAP